MSSRATRGIRTPRSFAALRRSFVVCALALVACRSPDDLSPGIGVSITADTTRGLANTSVILGGFSSNELRYLDDGSDALNRPWERAIWAKAFRVSIAGDTTPIVGRYSVTDSSIDFQPSFPFDLGRDYDVVVEPRLLSKQRPRTQVVGHFRLPKPDVKPSTRVARIYPTGDTLPENLLRVYVEFSAPMSREGGLPYVKLVDNAGNEVRDAFLPLDADFWNREHTRYTLFLDPGRVKRGILPNEQLGRALAAGKRYSIIVDSAWRDANGQPLVSSHRKRFRAIAADFRRVSPAAWAVDTPVAGSALPLVVRFDEPLDHGLLSRALGVEDSAAQPIEGRVEIAVGEREWRFTPARAWTAGDHRIVVLEFLEDLAGNRVNRAFEVDLFQRADSSATPSRTTIPFRIR